MKSSLKIASNANSTKPTSVCAAKNDKKSHLSSSSSSKRKKKQTITKPPPNRPNSLLADSKAFEFSCTTTSNSTSQASLHFTKNSLSSPATENPTDSVFTMYQKSNNKSTTAALSVADVKFIDETVANINRNNSNNQMKTTNAYSSKNSSNNKYSSPELTPTTNLFPIFSQLESTVQSQVHEKSPESPKKPSKKALQDKLSSLPREFSDSSVSSDSETATTTHDVNNNKITTIFRYEPGKTQAYKKITKTQVQSSKLQKNINNDDNIRHAVAATNTTSVLSPNTSFVDRKLDRNNQKCLYSLQKSSTPRYDLAEGEEEGVEEKSSHETANSLEALYEPNLENNKNSNNDDENTIKKYATFPRKIVNKADSVATSKKAQVWEKRKVSENMRMLDKNCIFYSSSCTY